MTDDELRQWARTGMSVSVGSAVLRVLNERDALRRQSDGYVKRLTAHLAVQGELLARCAAKLVNTIPLAEPLTMEEAELLREAEIIFNGTAEERDKLFERRINELDSEVRFSD